MSRLSFADRIFTTSDQDWFASVSGDTNPMHMDALAARRTMAGSPVVHGIHTLLWALNCLYIAIPDLQPLHSLKVNFEKMIYVGDRVATVVAGRETTQLHC